MTFTYKTWTAGIASLLSIAVSASVPAGANPQGGQVKGGQATIDQSDPASTIIRQGTDKAIIDWQSFSIGAGEKTQFIQPNSGSVALNRVVGQDPSRILGELIANGKIIVMNPNGLTVGPSGKINAHSFIATTSDISNDDFMAGRLNFDKPGNPQSRVINEGTVTAAEAGLVAFVAPSVKNSGVITARLGKIALAAGNKFVIDFYGDDLVSFAVGAEVVERITGTDGQEIEALVEAGGRMEAQTVVMSARAAREIVNTVISVSGDVAARTVSQNGGVIRLSGGDNGAVKVTGTLDASGANGGVISITGNAVHAGGTIKAEGAGGAQRSASGGTITIEGKTFASADGKISADGMTGGGITVKSGQNAAVNGTLSAKGTGGQGGTVSVTAPGENWEADGAVIDVSGTTGGTINTTIGKKLVTSARYIARGTWGDGGTINVTAKDMFLFSSTFDASGMRHGGTVRLGGEYQGGKGLTVDLIPNAKTLAATDGVRIDVSSLGQHGNGGTAIIWGDDKATFLGFADARPGAVSGAGGLVEASSLGTLTWRGTIETARNGQRGGTLLLDPKNIIVADAAYSQLNLILGAFQDNDAVQAEPLEPYDDFGASVALNGRFMAVGATGDDGADGNCLDCGAVYLFTFTDLAFNGAKLTGRIGQGYTGTNNISLPLESSFSLGDPDRFGASVSLAVVGDNMILAAGATGDDGVDNLCGDCGAVYTFLFNGVSLQNGFAYGTIGSGYAFGANINVFDLSSLDSFGAGVSLDGQRLAVGAPGDDGASESCIDCGAVYLFSFPSFIDFGVLEAKVGEGYSGSKDIDLGSVLGAYDNFGASVSVDGTRLAAGATLDNGASESCDGCGAVHLFTFTDSQFNGGALAGTIGAGYTGPSSFNVTALEDLDLFGSGVSLDGNRLVVGAPLDDGASGLCVGCGAAYLFTFTGSGFSSIALEGRIGDGYAGGKNIDLNGALHENANFGGSVALDGTRLAVGTPGDTGFESCEGVCRYGAVHLLSFSDLAFNGGVVDGRIGANGNVAGGKNISISELLDPGDRFGTSVALGFQSMVVGAPNDDGAGETCTDCGAVYLFTFTGQNFSGGALAGRIGHGYTGGVNIDLAGTLAASDNFGQAVSVNNLLLAVGTPGDDGATNACTGCGAVYLFSFWDNNFSFGSLAARVGAGYTGGNNIDLSTTLDAGDRFGWSVALDFNRLAAGAPGDDGALGACTDCGAVRLFTFSSFPLTGGTQVGTIGQGYVGSNNIDLTAALDANDQFGLSVSLYSLHLGVGSLDDGAANTCTDCGALSMFAFGDFAFGDGSLYGRFGAGYTGTNDFNLAGTLQAGDRFGAAATFEFGALGVGAPGDDGASDACTDCGAVYLFNHFGPGFPTNLAGRIGAGYTGGSSIDMADQFVRNGFGGAGFGSSVSQVSGTLAVGAAADDGSSGTCSDCGAVYLFGLNDSAFGGGKLIGRIGADGYVSGENISLSGLLEADDKFGISVSLDGTRLAVGALYDDGAAGDCGQCGAVYMFTFLDEDFTGGALAGRIGHGYSGAKDVNLASALQAGDFFGRSVSLQENRLAAGASLDDGAGNACTDCGAVYLFSFSNSTFDGGVLEGRVGHGYAGAKDINLAGILDADDHFGISVALEDARLAVGAEFDDGFADDCTDCGAAYLFTYTPAGFTGGALAARIGHGYTGTNDINLAGLLASGDLFGVSLALEGNGLAVGSMDDGQFDDCVDCGAVDLFVFADPTFAGGVRTGRIGKDYFGFNDVDLSGTLNASDVFGYAVSLDNGRLAVGAYGDDGEGEFCFNCGAVYLFSFGGPAFTFGQLEARIGGSYSEGKNIDLSETPAGNTGAQFGFAVSLDGARLAASSLPDDGAAGTCADCGAVHVFTFNDLAFNGGEYAATIGAGYLNTLIDLKQHLYTNDNFGYSVALNENRLAVGVAGDDGALNTCFDCGAVHLFLFNDTFSFSGARLVARIGSGYSGPNDIDVSSKIDPFDGFGSAVAFADLGLAAGAMGDDGAFNDCDGCGAVHVFQFALRTFEGGEYRGTVGSGYFGDYSASVALEDGDAFGTAVALNGFMMAVAAPGDDGAAEDCGDCGAVHLFSVSSGFLFPWQTGTIGDGYAGSNSIDLTLDPGDRLTGVALDFERLVIGAPGDDGFDGECTDCGAAYLFTFDAFTNFTNGDLAGTVGAGYTSGQSINMAGVLESGDEMGRAVALGGTTLALGAPGVGCQELFNDNCGAVGIFRFLESNTFRSGNFVSSLSDEPSRPTDVAVDLDAGDRFGFAVALGFSHLVVGAPGDDGSTETCTDCGAVYVLSKGRIPGALTDTAFDDDASGTMLIETATLENILSGGTSIALQANNDIIFYDTMFVSSFYDAGDLTLNAGRNVFLAGNMFTGGGDLIVTSNDPGHIPAHRDPGKSEIWAPNFIDAGAGRIDFTLFDPPGDITVGPQTAAQITHVNFGPGNIIVNGTLTATGGGDSIILAVVDGLFINNVGPSALNPGAGRFLVYSNDWTADSRNGIVANNLYNRTWTGNPPASITQPGNLFIYSEQPTVTITADNDSRDYGAPNPAFTYSVSGLVNGDTATYAFTGAPSFTTGTTAASIVGFYAGDISTSLGTLLSDAGYAFAFESGDLTIDPAALVITALNQGKDYGTAFSFLGTEFSALGLQNGETIGSASLSSLASAATAGVAGSPYTINISGAAGGTFDPANYDISYVTGLFTVDPAALTVTANGTSKTYGQTVTFAGTEFTALGLQNGETIDFVTLTSTGAASTAGVAGSPYTINVSNATGSTFDAANYVITYVTGLLTVDPASLTVSASNVTKTYGQTLTFAGTEFNATGLQNGETIGAVTLTSAGTAGSANVAGSPYTINISNATGGTFDAANYIITYATGFLTVDPAVLTVTAGSQTREYGDSNAPLTATITGFQNGETASVLTSSPVLSTAATAASNVGSYVIGVTGATAANYVFNYVAGTLTVTQAPLTVEVQDAARFDDEPDPAFSALITGFKFTSDTAALISGLSFTTSAAPTSPPGLYTISSVGGTALNYFIQIRIDGILEVLARSNSTVESAILNPEDDGGIQVCSNEDSGSAIPAADDGGILAGCLPLKISSSRSGSTTRCFNSF